MYYNVIFQLVTSYPRSNSSVVIRFLPLSWMLKIRTKPSATPIFSMVLRSVISCPTMVSGAGSKATWYTLADCSRPLSSVRVMVAAGYGDSPRTKLTMDWPGCCQRMAQSGLKILGAGRRSVLWTWGFGVRVPCWRPCSVSTTMWLPMSARRS